jgi:HD-GYP domain-containing protein (c-di-GMP phosphodiesterase class II)
MEFFPEKVCIEKVTKRYRPEEPTIGVVLAEQLVGEARERRKKRMDLRERRVDTTSACFFVLAAAAIAFFAPDARDAGPVLVLGLVAAYAVVSRVRFEFGDLYVVPEQLIFVPMLVLAPLPLVPLLVMTAGLLSLVPDFINGTWHRDRWVTCIGDSWFSIGPVLVLLALAPGTPSLDLAPAYALAFAAQLLSDLIWSLVRDRLTGRRLPLVEILRNFSGTARVDAVLAPLAFFVSLAALDKPVCLLALGPLVWLLDLFARDRQERYAAALELHRAYRGTVMLLSDVVEFDDPYTAEHSRSIVDLVHVVADELGVAEVDRQELEFAALLHDVGKIAMPKQILNKPSALTASEFEVMKTHTIEGQFMLDRVGGLLARVGEIVRSCHERWDGTGYPDALKGTQIPFASRIVFACDAFNAMTTDRVYRRAMGTEEALRELAENAGTQFDPEVVAVLISTVRAGTPVTTPVDGVRAVLANAQLPRRVGASA